ncbi:MAG: multiheme c-type cytochrome, partial [Planctomycetota bacterium]
MSSAENTKKLRYVPAVTPRLRVLLFVVLALFSLLSVTGLYLGAITFAEWRSEKTIQNVFTQYTFLGHLAFGLLALVPFFVFGVIHIRNARWRKNRRAVRAGYALFVVGGLVLLSGGLLMQVGGFDLKHPIVRRVIYWIHIVGPLVAVWLFVLHRLAGKKIRWRVGASLAGASVVLAIAMVALHSQDPKNWNLRGPDSGEQYFFPSLARTATGKFIPASSLMKDEYCKECHEDAHKSWSNSVHRFSSFNNPAYLFSVRETRKVALERDGDVQASRFCAGCHDPVPFFSGAFDDPNFDDEKHETAHAGITCSVCHSITHVSVRGNAEYTIEEPSHYPFVDSKNPFLQWVNRQLIKARPALHKKTFLKPLHKSPEFCGSCHKVHLPKELNEYKWLRGQNHYDSHLLSGVSGHGVTSFYYPPKAKPTCNGCHMELQESQQFGAGLFDDSGVLKAHDHMFPSANTAIPKLVGLPNADEVIERHREFLEGSLRVDLFGVKKGGTIDGELIAPLRPNLPTLKPGDDYLLEAVLRTLTLGHLFTQGTADSNEIWVEVRASSGGKVFARSGSKDERGEVDPWSHFVNSYVLDREGKRIDRRNAQDIFTVLYNHQIPPGAADVIHYLLRVPDWVKDEVTVEIELHYRKFDAIYMRHVYGEGYVNDLPIVTIASDRVVFPVEGSTTLTKAEAPSFPEWQRWNDYGIGLLRKGSKGSRKGELRQAEDAFRKVGELGRPDGPLNRARVYVKEGRLEEAVEALKMASANDPPAPPWSVAWFTGLVNKQNGNLDDAITSFLSLAKTEFPDARRRGFDFSRDYRLLVE